MDLAQLIQEIQSILAPALMISSAALLLLGFHNKFSNLASRFRVLNQEARQLAGIPVRNAAEQVRLESLSEQVGRLFRRASLMKNAILSLYASVLCFIGTSLLLLINLYSTLRLYSVIVAVFALGLVLLFAAVAVAFCETRLFYEVLTLERHQRREGLSGNSL